MKIFGFSFACISISNKGRSTNPNVWFVGVTPRRNPELVVAVLWQNGNKSWFAARIGARFVSAYVEKQRKLAHNLVPPKAPTPPVEVGAVWTTPNPATDGKGETTAKLHAGKFYVGSNGVVPQDSAKSQNAKTPKSPAGPESAKLTSPAIAGKAAQVKSQ